MKTINLNLLNRKYFILALVILLANDFYLKAIYSNWLTGKLSDFAGLFIFPYFFSVFLKGKSRLIYILTTVGFVYWKSPYSQFFIDFVNNYLPIHINRVVDFSDLISLLILPFSYFYLNQKNDCKTSFNILKAIIIGLTSLFAFSATTCKKNRPEMTVEDSLATTLIIENSNFENTNFDKEKHLSEGIILSKSLKVYNDKKEEIGVINNNLWGQIVKIDSISSLKFDLSNSKDECNRLNFIKISSHNITGWVHSAELFELEESNRDTSFIIKGLLVKTRIGKNFGVGVWNSENDQMSYCDNVSPVVLYNSKFNKNECIIINGKQEVYSKGYFTLDSHDGWSDAIKSVKYENNQLVLGIEREHQEGYEDIILKINLNEKQSFGEIISVTKRD